MFYFFFILVRQHRRARCQARNSHRKEHRRLKKKSKKGGEEAPQAMGGVRKKRRKYIHTHTHNHLWRRPLHLRVRDPLAFRFKRRPLRQKRTGSFSSFHDAVCRFLRLFPRFYAISSSSSLPLLSSISTLLDRTSRG